MPSSSFSQGIAPETRLSGESLFDWIERAVKAYSEVKNLPVQQPSAALNRLIDHTLLKPEATVADLERLCAEAREWKFYSVCVNPQYVERARKLLQGSETKVITVVGFPLGANLSSVKAYETQKALASGAQEIDMVLSVGLLRSGDWQTVLEDIQEVRRACGTTPLKVILETALLDTTQKLAGCALSRLAGADFVKTSTGFASGGARVEDIKLMRWAVGTGLGVKASGRVRSREDADKLVAAGATRLGASASVAICRGTAGQSGGTTKDSY